MGNGEPQARRVATFLRSRQREMAGRIAARQFAEEDYWGRKYGEAGRVKCEQDNGYHLDYLIEALLHDSPLLFEEYIVWAAEMLAARQITPAHLRDNLEAIAAEVREILEAAESAPVLRVLEAGSRRLDTLQQGEENPSFVASESARPEIAEAYLNALLAVDRRRALQVVLDAVEQGVPVRDIYMHVFQPVQREIGRLWQINRISVGQEHFCTAVTQHVMSSLYPYIFSTERKGRTLVAACVSEELHEIGLRMVADLFEMEGWDTFYLGASTPLRDLVQMVIARRADLLALSATITPHVSKVAAIIEAIRANPEAQAVKILVGGYPFNLNPTLGQRVGADGFAPTAEGALTEAARLLGEPA